MKSADEVATPGAYQPRAAREMTPRGPSSSTVLQRLRPYAMAVIAVAVALGLAIVADSEIHANVELAFFLMAIAVTVWFGSPWAGVLAIVLSSLAFNYFFTDPRYSLYIEPADQAYFVCFVLFALLIGWFGSRRRRIELALRQARDELVAEVAVRTQQASLLDLTHDTIFVRDMSDVITFWNRGAQELYGWTAAEAIGKPAHQLLKTSFPMPLDEIRAEVLRAGRWDGELGKTKSDGTRVVVASRWSLQRDEHDQPTAILETNNDITERKRAEQSIRMLNADLERRRVQLEAANKELEAFAYSTSHDLRAPLRHLQGYTELLQKNASAVLDEKGRRYVGMILEAAKTMGNLIDDLLTFSRIGRAEAQMGMVNLGPLVREARIEVERETGGRNIVWKIGALPTLHGDRSMLRVALVNLLSNAAKFTRTRPQAEIEIGCNDGKPGEVVVFVKDNGVGFDMRYVNKLFGVFQRLHRTEVFEGTGIGLATVQRVVARHGGRVWAEGEVDRGATFYFSAPKP
jgi:PAS domain S-box-containing protein